MSDSPPTLGYRSAGDERAGRKERARRRIGMLGRVVAIAIGAIVFLLVACVVTWMLYEHFRHKTTLAEVQGWIAALPANAGPGDVQRLFDAKGMQWSGGSDGLQGYARGETDFPEVELIFATVRFDQSGHIKGVDYREQWMGP